MDVERTTLNQENNETRRMTKTIMVEIPQKPQSSSQNPRDHCDRSVSSCSMRLLLQNHSNFKRSGEPSRIMYYEDGFWLDFYGDVVHSLKSEFLHGKSVVEAIINGSRYLFDFLRMLQIDLITGKQRSIAWIDVNGKCFFPKSFVGEDFTDSSETMESKDLENIKIEIEVTVNKDSHSSSSSDSAKRKEEVMETNDDEEDQSEEICFNNQRNFPKKQRFEASDIEVSRWPNAKLMKEVDRAYAVVKKFFLSGVRNVDPCASITSIYQCMRTGPIEKARWEVFRKQMEIMKQARGAANATFAWYGTSVKGVESILMHGFGMPREVSGSEAYGVGIYLSPVSLPQISAVQSEADEYGEKHVILCRVILGNVENVEVGSQQTHPSSVNFDTGVDDLKNPKRYIVWCANMNSRIIPECVVSYKSSDNPSAGLGGTEFMKWVPNATNSYVVKLFSKLESSLPSEKVRELKSLCSSYKAGKMAKDIFVKQLRIIVGDERLLSTIRETRG